MSEEDTQARLEMALEAAVPLLIAEYRERGGPQEWDWEWARSIGEELAGPAAVALMFRDAGGNTARTFARMARALAIGAFCPGGSRFGRCRWNAKEVNLMFSRDQLTPMSL